MNIDTGQIRMMPADFDFARNEREALLKRIVPIDLAHATEKQKSEMRVSLKDHRSELGKQLSGWRSKYVPHVGAKEAAKEAK